MKFNIIKPISSQVMEVNWIEFNTSTGSFIVLEGHAPLIATIEENREITVELQDGSVTVMTTSGGILEVNRDSVTLLLTRE